MIWLELNNDEIKQKVNDGELSALFAIDSTKYFGDIICLNCDKWSEKLDEMKKKIIKNMETIDNKDENKATACKYRLKLKYNGVLGVTNENITDEKALYLIEKHGRGVDLFDVKP